MKGKKLFALLLALVLACSVFAGCGGGGDSSGSSSGTSSAAGESSGETSGTSDVSQTETTGGEITWEDPYEVVMCYIYYGTLSEDLQMVEDAINEVALEKTNTQVSLLPLSFSEIDTQPSLMISSGEKLDLLLGFRQANFLNYINSNMLLELDDLYAQYGSAIAEDLGTIINGGYVGGVLYGIPSTRTHANSNGVMIVTDYVEKYGLDTNQDIGYEELDEFFAKVKEGEGENFTPMIISGANVTTFEFFNRMDVLGADIGCGAIIDYHNSTTVENVFASEEYATHLDWMRKWYEAGYINGDAVTNTENATDLVRNGLGCTYLMQTYWDMEANQEQGLQMDITAINLTGDRQTTDVYQGQTWSIPFTSENPEAAMAFLNLTYEDEKVVNMFYHGIEGVHYEMVDDAGIIKLMDGETLDTVGYNNPLGLYGAVDKMYQFNTSWGPEYFELMEEYNNNIPEDALSPFLGYTFNPADVSTEYSAVQDVVTQYRTSLETGSVNPDVILPEFLTALENAGIDTIIEANQASLDEWLAQQ